MRLSCAGLAILAFCILFQYPPCVEAETVTADKTAEALVHASGFNGGICVVLGQTDAELALSISGKGKFTVHTLYDNRAYLDKAREMIRSRGVYGQVSADLMRYDRLPYAENLVNIIVADKYQALESRGFPVDEALRVLTPLGVAFLGDSSASPDSAPAWVTDLGSKLESAGVKTQTIKENGIWLKITKPRPSEIDEWTHFLHGPDGNPVANDTVVGPPKHYQWVSDPLWLRSHDTDSSISTVITAGGRIYYIVDEGPISLPGDHPLPDKWFLAARDAFNGVLLWKVPIRNWGWREWKHTYFLNRPGDIPLNLEMRLVAAGDRLYVTLGYRALVSELDAKTGKTLKTYKGTEGTREILYHNGILVLTVPQDQGLKVAAINAEDGEVVWETKNTYGGTATDYINWKTRYGQVEAPALDAILNPACDGNTVSFLDGKDVVGLNSHTGEEIWRTKGPEEKTSLWMGAMIVKDGVALYASRTELLGISAETGEILWNQPKSYLGHLWYEWKEVFVIDGLVWTWSAELDRGEFPSGTKTQKTVWPVSVNGYDLHTGELEKKVPLGNIFKAHHHHRCYRNKATVKYILASRRGTEYVDLENGHHTVHNWVRGTCHYGMLPANGLQYAPPHPCRCYILEKINGFNALAPEIPAKYRRKDQDNTERLEKGPAYSKAVAEEAGSGDWPTFRHDPMRSGSAQTETSEELELLWNVKPGGKLSAPVIVGERVFLALTDEHQVAAFSAKDGKRLWEFCAGGRVDSPPTYFKGMLLFGSADGWVYCVNASDGHLSWRFRAAPEDRRMCAFGQLESAWPVSGSVLVLNGTAYLAAGRSSHLDGGIHLYALDALSGKVIHHEKLEGPFYNVENITENFRLPEGALTDILVGDDKNIYMRGYRFDHKLVKQKGTGTGFGARGGFLDDSYFRRAAWYFDKGNNYGNIIVNDDESFYSIRMFESTQILNPKNYFTPGGRGYLLLAQEQESYGKRWSTRLPVRVRTMVLADKLLFTAGPPDIIDPTDPLGAFEGRRGGVLNTFDTRSGQKLSERKLDSPPIFNGAAAANGKLYIAMEDGSLSCFGSD